MPSKLCWKKSMDLFCRKIKNGLFGMQMFFRNEMLLKMSPDGLVGRFCTLFKGTRFLFWFKVALIPLQFMIKIMIVQILCGYVVAYFVLD